MPFSIFPSSYKEADTKPTTTTQTHEELEVKLPQKPGRVGQHSSFQVTAEAPASAFKEEEVRITREEDRYRRPGVYREEYIREERR